MKPILEVLGLSQNFGGLRALNDVDVVIHQHEIVALIGPNGAGKTTFFNCITGIYTPTEGDIWLHMPDKNTPDDDTASKASTERKMRLNGRKPNEITALGMARTFQNIRIFPDMTVLENVMLGRHCRTSTGIWGALTRHSRARKEEQEIVDVSYALLEAINLQHQYNEVAKNLSYGAQRRLEIARALATDPHLLLLDEPAAGMNPQETLELQDLVRQLRLSHNLSVLLIEHDMDMVMSLSDRIYVMEYGSGIATGTPEQVRSNPRVIKAYLGEDDHA